VGYGKLGGGEIIYTIGSVILILAALLNVSYVVIMGGGDHMSSMGVVRAEELVGPRIGAAIVAAVFVATALGNFYLLHRKPPHLARVIVPLEVFLWIPLVQYLWIVAIS
jgi:hypothetical protein